MYLFTCPQSTSHLRTFITFFKHTATTEIYTLSLHDALPIFQPSNKRLTYPWAKGLKVEDVIAVEDDGKIKEWEHPDSGAELIKARHPEFEMWNQGVHARSGVACADCHMPYKIGRASCRERV